MFSWYRAQHGACQQKNHASINGEHSLKNGVLARNKSTTEIDDGVKAERGVAAIRKPEARADNGLLHSTGAAATSVVEQGMIAV